MRAVVFSVVLLGFMNASSPSSKGEPPTAPKPSKPDALEKALCALRLEEAQLLQFYGADHPEVVRVRARIETTKNLFAQLEGPKQKQADKDELTLKGPVFVGVKDARPAVLSDAQIRSLGARQFLVGISTKSGYINEEFANVGKPIWYSLADIGEMVELTPPPKEKAADKSGRSFKGTVLVSIRDRPNREALEDPVTRSLGGRQFLVGLSVKNKRAEGGASSRARPCGFRLTMSFS